MPNNAIPAAAEGMPNPNSPDHPWIKARRLARELADVLNDCDGGKQMVEIYPSKTEGREFPVLFAVIDYLTDSAEDRLRYHAREFARVARQIDPTATQLWIGRGESDNPQRFWAMVARKEAK